MKIPEIQQCYTGALPVSNMKTCHIVKASLPLTSDKGGRIVHLYSSRPTTLFYTTIYIYIVK